MSGKVLGWDAETKTEFEGQPEPGEHRYTVYLEYGWGVEEVDVNATSADEALRLVREYVPGNYEPGCKIEHVEGPRVGFYM